MEVLGASKRLIVKTKKQAIIGHSCLNINKNLPKTEVLAQVRNHICAFSQYQTYLNCR